jgi:hypothetical protein
MSLLNFRKRLLWNGTPATIRQGYAFGTYNTASAALLQIDTGLNNVKAFAAMRDATGTRPVIYNYRVSATDTGVVQIKALSAAGSYIGAGGTFRWIAIGDSF